MKKEDDKDMVKRVLGLKQIDFLENGELRIMGISGVLTPTVTYTFFIKLLREKVGKEKTDSILYFVGENQGMQGVDLLVKKFGYKKSSKEIMAAGISQEPMIGFGKSEIARFDESKKHIIIHQTSSQPAETYRNLFGFQDSPFDSYWRGILGGLARRIFDADMVAVEKECIAMGKQKCIIEIKERKEFEKEKEFIRKQLPNDSLRPTEIELKKWFSK